MDLHGVRTRFWVEVTSCGLALLLTALAVVRRDWIEALLPLEPDGGSGELEWLLAVAALCVAVGLAVAARLEWRGAHAGAAPSPSGRPGEESA